MNPLCNLRRRSARSFLHKASSIHFHPNVSQFQLSSTSSVFSHKKNAFAFSKYQKFTYAPCHLNAARYFSSSSSSSSQSVTSLLDQIQSLEERQQCRGVVDAILLDPRTKLPHDEYMTLCTKQKLNEEQAKKLAEALHTTGIIWSFSNYFEEKQPLIIKTNEVCKAFLRTLDLEGTIRTEYVEEKRQQLKARVLEIKPLEEQHQEIELRARKFVRICWRTFFGYVVSHCMLVPYLTFWKYSWDIMEPVTYMFNLWTLFMGTWFYLNSSMEFSNEGISQSLMRMKKEKLYRKYKFDIERYTLLQEKIAEIEDDLFNPEWALLKSVHPQVPDYIKHIHLTPDQLLKKFKEDEN